MLHISVQREVATNMPISVMRILRAGAAKVRGKKSVSIVMVPAAKAKLLNRRYRGGEYFPDVLSFTAEKGEPEGYIGEVVVAPAIVREYARRSGNSFEKELAILTIHGIMHLLGHDHKSATQRKKMLAATAKVFGKLYTA